jgi:hypothetical protein
MKEDRLIRLQEQAICDTLQYCRNVVDSYTHHRLDDLKLLHFAAHMDIEMIVKSLGSILAYKKELAKQMLGCGDNAEMKLIAEHINHVDNMLCKVLGIYRFNDINDENNLK